MAAKTIYDLLPIPKGNTSPHAYEVFGLTAGEADMAVVSAAVQETVSRLRAIKSETDPAIWKTAAKVVQAARVTLADPTRKAELDARFGILPIDAGSTQPAAVVPTLTPTPTPTKIDPLAGMLPPSNPLAPVQAPVMRSPDTQAAPSQPVAPGPIAPTPTAPTPPVIRKNQPPVKRRRRSIFGTLVMTTFMVGTLALIGALIYFLLYGPGTLAITSKDGSLTIQTGPSMTSDQLIAAPPMASESMASESVATGTTNQTPKPRFDPVMGTMAGDVPPPMTPADVSQPIAPEPVVEVNPSGEMEATATQPEAVSLEPIALEPIALAEADAAIARAATFIRASNWEVMKTVAEEVADLPMTDDKKIVAEGLYQLADLVTFYRGGVVKGVESLTVANDFEVTPDFRIVIVETGPDLLVVRAGAKNRSYTFDQIPFKLSEKLATFSIDAGPTRQAAMAAYQAVSPLADEGHRDQAVKVFESLRGQIEGAEVDKLIAAMKHLYPQPN